jgi:hypothetical protein
MNFNNQNESKDLENILLKVKFNKEINDLYYSMGRRGSFKGYRGRA